MVQLLADMTLRQMAVLAAVAILANCVKKGLVMLT
jgi:hypothetical protein